MKRSMAVAAALALAAMQVVHLMPAGAKPDAPSGDEAAIRTMFTGLTAAYNKNDAELCRHLFLQRLRIHRR